VAEWPKAAVCKGYGNHKTGLKSMNSGPFFHWWLGYRWVPIDGLWTNLGTLAGTLQPMPMCAFWAHVVLFFK